MTAAAPAQRFALDPFFDGDGGNVRTPLGAPVPGTENYRDISTERLANDRTIADRIPHRNDGIRGVVIPHATPGGTVRGIRPNDLNGVQIVVDPHIEGQSAVLDLGQMTPALMDQATNMAAQMTPEPDSIQTQRLRGSAAMHGVAALNGGSRRTISQGPATIPSPNLGRMGQPVPRNVRPLQAFAQQPQPVYENGSRELRAIDIGAPTRQIPTIAAPTMQVLFEIEHFGTHEAVYHDVLVGEAFIVLIYRTDYQGSKYFPENRDVKAPPLALMIQGQSKAYLVHTTGVRYVYEGNEHCVLLVERVTDMPPEG
jgi:hypothetical protein